MRSRPVRVIQNATRWGFEHRRLRAVDPSLILRDGLLHHPLDGRRPQDVSIANAELVLGVLDESAVPYTEVRNHDPNRASVAVEASCRDRIVRALMHRYGDHAVYVAVLDAEGDPPAGTYRGMAVRLWGALAVPIAKAGGRIGGARVIRVWRSYLDLGSGLTLGEAYACDLELWTRSASRPNAWVAPRANVAATELTDDEVQLEPRRRLGPTKSSSVFDRRFISDIDFPIDVVYTWVDDADPAWREKLQAHAESVPAEDHHPQAMATERFRSRDELRYSLRSVDMFAPWVRRIFIVTDGQVPDFLDLSSDRVSVIDHREIARDVDALPVFNSNAIISWLHRIPGLAEHYLYLNDDVFLGRDTQPSLFFTASGLCKVFPSRTLRPFGPSSPVDEPHVNITRNIRRLLELEFGRTISNAVKHTPHAQLVSVQEEMEERFAHAYLQTARHRFRHHEDIAADQLFHYYAQMTGRAIVGEIRYGYMNTGDRRAEPELARVLARRDRDVFCLNDAPTLGQPRIADETVRQFLTQYFPVPGQHERTSRLL